MAAMADGGGCALLCGSQMIDCTHTIDEQAFTFVGCFPGAETYFRNRETGAIVCKPAAEAVPGVDVPFTDARFELITLRETVENDASSYIKCCYRIGGDVGTHIDSPLHWYPGARGISDLTFNELVARGAVIDCTDKVEANSDYLLTVADLLEWEDKFGPLPDRAFVVMKTGWGSKYGDIAAYLGLRDGDSAFHFPGFSVEAANFLLNERSIVGIGIDTASLDFGPTTDFPVHQVILGASKYQIENMNLAEVPEGAAATFVSMPLKVANGPEAPVRVMAVLKEA